MPLASRSTPPSFATTISGKQKKKVNQDSKSDSIITVPGADRSNADFPVDSHNLIGDGDFEALAESVGGTSLIVVSLNSNDGTYSVEIDLLKEKDYGSVDSVTSDDVLRTETPNLYTDQETINSRTVPVAADNIRIRITDTSGGSTNTVNGSINLHTGGPSSVLNLDNEGAAISPRTESSDHKTGSNVDVNSSTENVSMAVPGRPDSVRVLVTNAGGDFTVTISFDNTSVSFSGGSGTPVDVERAVMSNSTVDVSISDDSGSSNTINYDVLLV